MVSILIDPINHQLNHSVVVPGSKSLTNRAMMIAALAKGTTVLRNPLISDDSMYFAKALQSLGFSIEHEQRENNMTVTGLGGSIPVNFANLFIGNAGTAARFLSAFLTLGTGEFIIDGDTRMRERPIGDLVSALSQLGANVGALNPTDGEEKNICPPIIVKAAGLPGGKAFIAGDISSQFLSALLMASPYAKSQVEVYLTTELNSKPYVDMTIGVMADFGIGVQREDYHYFKTGTGIYKSQHHYVIEPDASAASYFFAAAALLGGSVRVENLTSHSKQGDVGFVNVLEKMGCTVEATNQYTQVYSPASLTALRGIEVDMSDIPDTAQTLAVIAPFASSPTHIYGIESARVKESDRVKATCTELAKLGVEVEEHRDGMTIYPGKPLRPARIKTYKDHRMAMAFALIGLKVPGVEIDDPECVRKTFPDYFKVLDTLR